MATMVIIQCVLVPNERTIIKRRDVGRNSKCHSLSAHCSHRWPWCRILHPNATQLALDESSITVSRMYLFSLCNHFSLTRRSEPSLLHRFDSILIWVWRNLHIDWMPTWYCHCSGSLLQFLNTCGRVHYNTIILEIDNQRMNCQAQILMVCMKYQSFRALLQTFVKECKDLEGKTLR